MAVEQQYDLECPSPVPQSRVEGDFGSQRQYYNIWHRHLRTSDSGPCRGWSGKLAVIRDPNEEEACGHLLEEHQLEDIPGCSRVRSTRGRSWAARQPMSPACREGAECQEAGHMLGRGNQDFVF